jgi:hypothetical protein
LRIRMPKYPTKDPNLRILAHQKSCFTHDYPGDSSRTVDNPLPGISNLCPLLPGFPACGAAAGEYYQPRNRCNLQTATLATTPSASCLRKALYKGNQQ